MGCTFSKSDHDDLPAEPKKAEIVGKNDKIRETKQHYVEPPKPIPSAVSFTYDELSLATINFSKEKIVDGTDQSRNLVYRGLLNDGSEVVIKKFSGQDWREGDLFEQEASKVAKIELPGWVRLIGYCNEGSNRLLIAEYMPNSTLANKLFHWEKKPMNWGPRLNTAVKLAQVLERLQNEGFLFYHDLNPYRILFDFNDEPRLSCFGLLKHPSDGGTYSSNLAFVPPEDLASGMPRMTPESIVFSYGTILLALISGKNISPNHFVEIVQKSNVDMLDNMIDSSLLNQPGANTAMAMVPLVARCLNANPKERPTLSKIIESLNTLERDSKSNRTMILNTESVKERNDVVKHETKSAIPPISPASASPLNNTSPKESKMPLTVFAEAALNCNFKALHDMLVKEAYGTPTQEVSFEYWTMEMQEKMSARKKGDQSFKGGRWHEAIELYNRYTQLVNPAPPLMYGRRCCCYLLIEEWNLALTDAMSAQYANPEWAEAYYLQVACLKMLNLHDDAEEMLKQGIKIEQQITADLEASA